ncbi:MAG: glucuronate isomerase [Halothermotrichaceae bacterium]
MTFLGNRYLLDTDIAETLYQQIKDLPIVDLHNHGHVKEIVKNEGWTDIWEVEGATDHYVWELMRKAGIAEDKITGNVDNKEKWLALAEVFSQFVGNPTYEWIHLDLKRCFGIDEIICADTAEHIWQKSKELLKNRKMNPQNLLKKMNVEIMCTTDDPISDLKYHIRVENEVDGIKILPTWRPDKAMNIDSPDWLDYAKRFCQRYENDYGSLQELLDSLKDSHDFFADNGCLISDHGLTEPVSYQVNDNRASEIYQKALSKKQLSEEEVRDFRAYMFCYFGELNAEKGWTTQLHIGSVRDYNISLYENIGKDSGGDISTNRLSIAENLKYFVNRFDGKFPVILYCLDPTHLPTLATISRAFRNISIGAAWWFNDSPYGIEEHLKYIATVDLLSIQPGMVTDSRKLMSYGSRTEVFRRVLANVVGNMVKRGQIPLDNSLELIKQLCYRNPKSILEGK